MKKIFLFMLPLAMLCSCGDFLEEYSQNEIRPKTVDDLQKLMVGEVYPLREYFVPYLELMTDDADSGFTNKPVLITELDKGEGPFTWSTSMFDLMKEAGGGGTDTWERYYSRIKGCNVVLDNLDRVEGSVEAKEKITGEALAIRAFYYFQLINLYAKPYNAPGIDRASEPGVPLILTSVVTDLEPERARLEEVWARIEGDLLTALPLMEAHGRAQLTKYRVSDLFVHTLLSRMYLYQERWDKAAEHASIVLERKPALLKLSSVPIPTVAYSGYGSPDQAGSVMALSSPELIWGYSQYREFIEDYYTASDVALGDDPPFKVSQSLKDIYEYDLFSATDRKDLRPTFYYAKYRIPAAPGITNNYDLRHGNQKSFITPSGGPVKGMRTAELYLNRAEANAQLFIATGDASRRTAALADLNTLREARYDTRNTAYVPVEIADGAELLQFCRDERRRELCYEEHRWFDLRRYGMPEIRHSFRKDALATPIEYVLEEGDPRYVLTLPQWVLERNPNL